MKAKKTKKPSQSQKRAAWEKDAPLDGDAGWTKEQPQLDQKQAKELNEDFKPKKNKTT